MQILLLLTYAFNLNKKVIFERGISFFPVRGKVILLLTLLLAVNNVAFGIRLQSRQGV